MVHWCVCRALGWAGLATDTLALTFTGTCFKDRVSVNLSQVGSGLSLEEEGWRGGGEGKRGEGKGGGEEGEGKSVSKYIR